MTASFMRMGSFVVVSAACLVFPGCQEPVGAAAEVVATCSKVCEAQSDDCPGEKLTDGDCANGCQLAGENADDNDCGEKWKAYVDCVAQDLEQVCSELPRCIEPKVDWAACDVMGV